MIQVTRVDKGHGHYYKVTGDSAVPETAELASVTTVINAVAAKPWLSNWAVSESFKAVDELITLPDMNLLSFANEARELTRQRMSIGYRVGNHVHEAVKIDLSLASSGELPFPSGSMYIDSTVEPGLRKQVVTAYQSFRIYIDSLIARGCTVYAVELPVYSSAFMLGGTIDCVAVAPGNNYTILDWKTGDNIGYDALLQVAAYTIMLAPLLPKGSEVAAAIVHLCKDGAPQWDEYWVKDLPRWRELFTTAFSLWLGTKAFKMSDATSVFVGN